MSAAADPLTEGALMHNVNVEAVERTAAAAAADPAAVVQQVAFDGRVADDAGRARSSAPRSRCPTARA